MKYDTETKHASNKYTHTQTTHLMVYTTSLVEAASAIAATFAPAGWP